MTKLRTKPTADDAATFPAEGPAGRALLVLGPEGSGTALAAGLLGLLGCDLPRDLRATGAADAEEAWASAGLSALAAGGVPDPDAARAALDEAFGPAPLPVLKARGLDAGLGGWLAAIQATGRGAVAILVLGAPAEPGGPEDAQRPWARALLRAERGSRALRRAVLDRDRLLLDWRGEADRLADRLGIAWPARDAAGPACDALVAAAPPGTEAAPLAGAAARLGEVLLRWAAEGEDPADHPTLDRLGAELGLRDPDLLHPAPDTPPPFPEERLAAFEDALLQRSAEATDHAQARAALAARLGQLDAELAEERAGRAADRRRIDRLTRDLAVLRREAMGELRARLDALPGALGTGARAADAARPVPEHQAATAVEERLRQESSRDADLERRLAQAERAGDKRRAEAEALAARLKEADRAADKRGAEAQALAARLKEAERAADKRRAEAEALAARLREAERQVRDFRAQADAARSEAEGLRRSTSWRLTAPLRAVLGAARTRRR